ncbi:hypothetical protein HDU86_003859 [Geranomyces michiganensis]|nr:hypothetical protein HDU86_003859 [Geranomyces michiganensis]
MPATDRNLYHFDPSIGGAVFGCLSFAGVFAAHIFYLRKYRTTYMWPMVVGALMEALGYAIRLYSRTQVSATGPYAGQQVLIIVAPVFVAAACYVILGRTIRNVGAEYSFIPPRWLSGIFVTADCFSFLVQSSASGMLVSAKDHEKAQMANRLLIGGLWIQVVSFTAFIILALAFHYRARAETGSWKTLMYALYMASVLILIRSVFRVIEFSDGFDGPIATNEALMYVFDFTLMLLACCIFLGVYPGKLLVASSSSGRTHAEKNPDAQQLVGLQELQITPPASRHGNGMQNV